MESLKELYRIGYGPSSSHTMGPQRAAEQFLKKYPNAKKYNITLYGSLASTGKGHLTDFIIKKTIPNSSIKWMPEKQLPFHPNAMDFVALDNKEKVIGKWRVYSIGGGALSEGKKQKKEKVYKLKRMEDIIAWCKKNKKELWQYVEYSEKKDMFDYLNEVLEVMKDSVNRGIKNKSILPGGLNLQRKANLYYNSSFKKTVYNRVKLFAYALAVSEENAGGGKIVTAPTCGSCGVVPAVLLFCQQRYGFKDKKIIRALAIAGLIGNLIKSNGSISGAEVGCQGEIGTACAMAAGAAAYLFNGTSEQVEYAAEMGIEHMLGMTCDPVEGLVQIPCIERNALTAGRALDCSAYSVVTNGDHRFSFDEIVKVMVATGKDLPCSYRETAKGGLAKEWEKTKSKKKQKINK